MIPNGERIASLEVEIKELKAEVLENKQQTSESLKDISRKLDTLIGLRNKGAGVLWLLGGLVSMAITLYGFFHWSK